jgi:Putative phage tail protein
MLVGSPAYRLAIPQTHRREHTFTVRTPGGELLAQDVPIGSGSVAARLTSRVTRTATFTASDEWFPVFPTDPLSPFQAIVEIQAGIGYPTGEKEVFPVFTGRVYEARRGADGDVSFRADDLAADVIAADFERPINAQPGASTVAEIERLITDGYEWATFGDHDVMDAPVPMLAWDSDRGKALDDLASALEGRWYVLGDGDFVVRRYAYADSDPVITLSDGVAGTMSSAVATVTADGAYNSVVVLVERADSTEPIRVVERNDNLLSAARYGGPFGKRVRIVRAQTALTVAEAQRMARAQLEAAQSLTRQWNITCVPDMTLEPGDVVRLEWREVRDTGVIDSITYPLDAATPMSISTRSSVDAEVSL